MLKRYYFLILAVVLASYTTVAHSQNSSKRQFGFTSAWKYKCNPEILGACILFNDFKANGVSVARVSIYPLDGDPNKEIIEVAFPLGISLTHATYLELDGREKYRLQLLTCKANGCIAFALKSGVLIQSMFQGIDMRLYFTDYDREELLYYKFDLTGYRTAYADYRTLMETRRSCDSNDILWPDCVSFQE